MITDYALRLFAAGFVYIVSPGPVFLAILGLVAEKGRRAGLAFTTGAVIGDLGWLLLTCLFLIGATHIPPVFFMGLSAACAGYLFWLGYKMIAVARSAGTGEVRIFKQPFRDGVALGLLNPKSYPVLVSVFSALVLNDDHQLALQDLPMLVLFSCAGYIAGYGVMVGAAGISAVKGLYSRHVKFFSILFGLIFIGFGIKLLTLIHS